MLMTSKWTVTKKIEQLKWLHRLVLLDRMSLHRMRNIPPCFTLQGRSAFISPHQNANRSHQTILPQTKPLAIKDKSCLNPKNTLEKNMRWLLLLLLFCLETSCIFVEGQIINEPEDVVVTSKMYQYLPEYPCHVVNVTEPERTTSHCTHSS